LIAVAAEDNVNGTVVTPPTLVGVPVETRSGDGFRVVAVGRAVPAGVWASAELAAPMKSPVLRSNAPPVRRWRNAITW